MAAMNTSGIRRNFKNIVHNYSDSQVKVREATSNDPWGPSSTLMSEIADLTYNVVAFSEIMQMIWKRLNDHGKNWRHVYKALVLLEYLIKTGTEKVAQQCKENIFAIQTLKDFQYFEENKDHGMNVREKAKQLVSLLKDDERLKNERTRALKARERFAQSTAGIGSEHQVGENSSGDGTAGYRYADAYGDAVSPSADDQAFSEHFNLERRVSSELEGARPQTAGEEELQLQLALAMSKEEAEQEEQKRRSDDVRLQMAITQSEEDFSVPSPGSHINGGAVKKVQGPDSSRKQSNLVDLLDMPVPGPSNPMTNTDPWGLPMEQQQQQHPQPPIPAPRHQSNDQWPAHNHSSPISSDPWSGRPASSQGAPMASSYPARPSDDPWNASAQAADPWGTTANSSFGSSPSLATNGELHAFDPLTNQTTASKSANNLDYLGAGANPFDGNGQPPNYATAGAKKTPENFLGENSNLVNLDALISSKPPSQTTGGVTNPFSVQQQQLLQQQQQQQPTPPSNTFQVQPPRISLNEIRTQQQFGAMGMSYGADPFAPQMLPIVPVVQQPLMAASGGHQGGQQAGNPFL